METYRKNGTMSEWLRSRPAKAVLTERVSSNLTGVDRIAKRGTFFVLEMRRIISDLSIFLFWKAEIHAQLLLL